MGAASWPSGAAAGTRVDEVEDEELDDDVEAPRLPAPSPQDTPPDASMSTRAASSAGVLPMSTSGPGVRMLDMLHLSISVDQGHLELCMIGWITVRL